MCCLFFDISKAFDKVWHNGLLYKLVLLNCPLYIVNWIKNFLKDRKLQINVNGSLSELADILCSVPQGSILSPLLFSIYINDIPKRNVSNSSGSLLYVDDLASFFIYKKNGNIENMINKYLKEIENWLSKWKMKMSATKCNYIIFHNGPTRPKALDLRFFNTNIPFEENPIFLGAIFDERLTFKKFIDKIITKCNDRQKVVKMLSNRFFNLVKTLFSVSNAFGLIGSVIDFSAFSISQLSRSFEKKLQLIQNSTIRSILYLPYYTSQEILDSMAGLYGITSVDSRAFDLI
jgi:hypothetical protein